MKLLNGVDNIPLELISAIENDEIVVFVGAGVSKPSPSNLPDFYELAKELGKENDKKVSKKEPIDRFLGDVADLNPEKPYLIHQKIIEKFSKVKTPNSLHENILKLFNNRIRIVTTNFDNLLSLKANQLGLEHKTYFAPALPYGDDFEGIVHLHGSIEDKPSNLIVTDKDFSNAYICRGWATTFLKELFSKYTVLFIGYSYNDTILNYLTRGIVSKKLFSIVENKDKDKWDRLGINSIGYVNADNSHSLLIELLIKIKEEILIDVITEKDKIKQLAKRPFAQLDDINKDYIKNRVLKKEWKIKQLLKNITDKNNWLKFFYENKNIDELVGSLVELYTENGETDDRYAYLNENDVLNLKWYHLMVWIYISL